MKESDANDLKRLENEIAELKARLKRAHKNNDALLDGHLLALRALSPGAAGARPSSDIVHGCVIRQVGQDAPDDTPISSIPGLTADNLGACINDSTPLVGKQAFMHGNIKSSDNLLDVINATTTRRGMQP
jgi:hypothetical protein